MSNCASHSNVLRTRQLHYIKSSNIKLSIAITQVFENWIVVEIIELFPLWMQNVDEILWNETHISLHCFRILT